MEVRVIEMHQSEYASGGHIWVDLHFESGRRVTVRVDEYHVNETGSRVYLSRDNEIGKEVTI